MLYPLKLPSYEKGQPYKREYNNIISIFITEAINILMMSFQTYLRCIRTEELFLF